MAVMETETITWWSVDDRLPDAELTVLLAFAGMDEDSVEGFLDGHDAAGQPIWRDVTAVHLNSQTVTYWAEKPLGPKSC
jgi:hypothetical protein